MVTRILFSIVENRGCSVAFLCVFLDVSVIWGLPRFTLPFLTDSNRFPRIANGIHLIATFLDESHYLATNSRGFQLISVISNLISVDFI